MILTDNTTLNLSIEKYNRLFLYLIMKSKKKYEKIYNKIKNINIKTIYKINSITQVEEEVKVVVEDIVKQIVEEVKVVETDIIVKEVKKEVKKEVENIVEQDIVEQEKFCMPCIIKNDKKCLCCKPKKLDLPLNITNRVVFPSYDELYLLMNITQQTLFTKQIYICAKLLYDNITNNDLIDRVCKKIYNISGINGLEFVNTIIKSISIN